MYTPADAKILKALSALENDKDFAVVIEWLKEMEKECHRNFPKAKDEVESRWIQGRMQVVSSILELINGAREKFERHEAVKNRTTNRREVLNGAHG